MTVHFNTETPVLTTWPSVTCTVQTAADSMETYLLSTSVYIELTDILHH